MEEKKITDDTEINVGMTDEEIIKPLECMANSEKRLMLKEIKSSNLARLKKKDILAAYQTSKGMYENHISDLQNKIKGLYNIISNQKVEIERLTEERDNVVEDTATEILIPLIGCEKQIDPLKTGIRWSVLKGFCKKFGVEVE